MTIFWPLRRARALSRRLKSISSDAKRSALKPPTLRKASAWQKIKQPRRPLGHPAHQVPQTRAGIRHQIPFIHPQNNKNNEWDKNKTIISNNEINSNKKDDKWNGCYVYEEQPVGAINKQYSQTMAWFLKIGNNNCILLLSGFQTYNKYECQYELIDDNNIKIIFIKQINPRFKVFYKKGDVLFQLKFNSQKELNTYWVKMEPLLSGGNFENNKINFIKKECKDTIKLIPHESADDYLFQ